MGLFSNLFSNDDVEREHLQELKKLKDSVTFEKDLDVKLEKYNLLFDYINKIENKQKLNEYIIKNSEKLSYGYQTDLGYFSKPDVIENFFKEYKLGFNKVSLKIKSANEFDESLNNIPKHQIVINKDSGIKRQSLVDMKNINFARVGKSFNKEKLFKFVVIDIETTGLSASRNKIIELSAIRFIDFEPTECFSTLINPITKISEEITKITSITNEMVKEAPTISEVIEDFDKFVSGFNIVGYNTIFDLKFLFTNGSRILEQKGIKFYDVCELAKKVIDEGESCKLDSVCEHFEIYRNTSHRSSSDCYATKLVFEKIIDEIVEN